MTAHQVNGLYKIFGPTTPGWGREASCIWNKSAQCLVVNVATSKGSTFYVSKRGNCSHTAFICELCVPSETILVSELPIVYREQEAGHQIWATLPRTFQPLSHCLLMPFANAFEISFLSFQKPLLFPFSPLIAAWSFNKHNFSEVINI